MPLPLGHAAIGYAAYNTIENPSSSGAHRQRSARWISYLYVTILANLPDLDVVYGLLVYGNGAAVHRGPTHSLLFALIAGLLASQLWRLWHRIPRFGFGLCFGIVFSHVAADMLLTGAPVSLLWPLEIYFSPGHSGWSHVAQMVLFQSIRDFGIIAACLAYVFGLRYMRIRKVRLPFSSPRKQRAH